MREVAIALGANLGDRLKQLQAAKERFKNDCAIGDSWAQSSLYETDPVACPEGAPDYLNGVILFQYEGCAETLLKYCKDLEREMGRPVDGSTGQVNLPRTLDADILYVGAETVNLPHLVIPHPRMCERKFVLAPLSEISGGYILPTHTETISEILEKLNTEEPSLVIYRKEW